jgi:hypothetical protein
VAEIAADVFGGIKALGVEAIGFDLIAAMVAVSLIDGFSQLVVEGTSLAEMLAQQVAPFGGQTATGQFVDLHPLAVFQAAFCHHEVNVRFEAQVTPASVKSVDHTDAHTWVELLRQLADGLGCGFQEQLQERAVGVEEGPEEVVDGEGDVEVGHVEEITGDVGNPVIDFDLAARRTEAGFAGEGDATVETAAGADVAGVAGTGVTTEDHTFDGFADVGTLVWRDQLEVQVAPAIPVFTEYAAKAVVGGGVGGIAPGRCRWVGLSRLHHKDIRVKISPMEGREGGDSALAAILGRGGVISKGGQTHRVARHAQRTSKIRDRQQEIWPCEYVRRIAGGRGIMVMDFEDWEPDYDLCMREDWPGLVRYRERVARRAPDNLYAQGRLGEAYVLNGEYERAIEFLSKLYHEHPYYTDAEHYLLDALFALGKNENDFDWVEKPVVFRLRDELLDWSDGASEQEYGQHCSLHAGQRRQNQPVPLLL